MRDYRNLLPANLRDRAYQANNQELAWAKAEALEVIDVLVLNRIAILGGEVWLPTHPGPTLPPPKLYVWDAGNQFNNEHRSDYVLRTSECARNYIASFCWKLGEEVRYHLPPFFNLTLCDETEYGTLSDDLQFLKECGEGKGTV
jgi:hypothetical protein